MTRRHENMAENFVKAYREYKYEKNCLSVAVKKRLLFTCGIHLRYTVLLSHEKMACLCIFKNGCLENVKSGFNIHPETSNEKILQSVGFKKIVKSEYKFGWVLDKIYSSYLLKIRLRNES